MNKQLIAAAVTVGLVVSANAGSSQESVAQASASKDGSLGSITALLSSGEASLTVLVDGSTTVAGSAANAAKDSVVYIVSDKTSTEMSADSGDASANSVEFVVDTSGNVYRVSKDAVLHPIKTSGNIFQASADAVTYTYNAIGQILSASGEYVSDKFGEPVSALRDASGEVLVASGTTLVISKDVAVDAAVSTGKAVSTAARSTMTFIDATSGDAIRESSAISGAMLEIISEAPGRIFNAAKRGSL